MNKEFKLLVQCPKCNNQQKCAVRTSLNAFKLPILNKKYKKCVYCGKSFSVKKHLVGFV